MASKIKPRPWVADPWFYTTYEGTRLLEIERAEDMSFLDRLRWNEQALATARLFHQAGQAARGQPPPPPPARGDLSAGR